jgi:hypothetical protein
MLRKILIGIAVVKTLAESAPKPSAEAPKTAP